MMFRAPVFIVFGSRNTAPHSGPRTLSALGGRDPLLLTVFRYSTAGNMDSHSLKPPAQGVVRQRSGRILRRDQFHQPAFDDRRRHRAGQAPRKHTRT